MTIGHDILRLPRVPRPLRAVLFAIFLVALAPYLITPFYAFGHPVSTVMLWRQLTGQRVVRHWVGLGDVDRDLVKSVVVAEDGRFCEHYGIDFNQIQNAIQDADSLEDMRGGSTITQQVAKNLFLWQSRSWVRKALEAPLALWVDLVLSKRRILELYLNVAEWGPDGEFGVQAGAERAFHHGAQHLSRTQAALLAAMLPDPHDRDAGHPDRGLRRLGHLYVVRAARAPAATTACLRR
ncbi:MAG TPA: monofunctional biosynthetic peptidoglycan transglycosylase [Pseudolabrys sp.]|nr:monofunctional biosynthetic peptidoglycan transglycosylase [Pseudolabrys sp.]